MVPVVNLQSLSSIISTPKQQQNENSTVKEFSTQDQLTSEVLHFMADPQILVSFKTLPGELPRDIAMERRRRQIASVDFLKLFGDFID